METRRLELIKEKRVASDEQSVWKGSPSQILNLGVFLLCGLFCWLIVPIFIGVYYWLKIRCHDYELTTERLRESKGVFSRTTQELELYRVKDSILVEPFWIRIFGLGTIELRTSDFTTPDTIIWAVPEAANLRDLIRKYVEEMREKKRVAEIDFKPGGFH